MARSSLFQYLGRPVPDAVADAGSRFTFTDTETYDDDPGIGPLAAPGASDSTSFTKTDGETFDDDTEASVFGVPELWDATRETRTDSETYDDDPGLGALTFPSRTP